MIVRETDTPRRAVPLRTRAGGGDERAPAAAPPVRLGRRAKRLVAAWAALGFLLRYAEVDAHAVVKVAAAVPSALTSGLFLASALLLTRRWPLGLGRRLAHAGIHAAAAVGLALLGTGVLRGMDRLLGLPQDPDPLAQVLIRAVGYGLLTGIAQAVVLAQRQRARELEALRLRAGVSEAELQRTEAELKVLKMELNPGFLFDALATVSRLMHRDVARANAVLVRVSDMLRTALDTAGVRVVTLEEEIELLRAYLDVELARLQDRLRVEWDVDEEALDAPVPHLILQTLVEGAIRRGDRLPAGDIAVRIEVRCDESGLLVAVEDDRADAAGPATPSATARLAQLHGSGAAVSSGPRAGGGTRVEARIPLLLGEPAPAPPPVLLSPEPALGAATLAALAERGARRPRSVRRRALSALPLGLWFGACLAIFADTLHGEARAAGGTVPWPVAVAVGAYSAAIWTAFVWIAFRITRRAPLERSRWARPLAVLAGTGLLLGMAAWVSRLSSRALVGLPASPAPLREGVLVVAGNTVLFLALAAAAHAVEYARRSGGQEAAELRLRAELSEAELQRTRADLQALKMELNPHFLFNALHTVSSLMYEDPVRADEVLGRLGQLLRTALDEVGTQEVALAEELEFLRAYVDVERSRLGERLRVEWRVDSELLGACVPHLILQPMVENAIKHGIGATPRGGVLVVEAGRDGALLVLAVEDDGAGVVEDRGRGDGRMGPGVGVSNTRARLARLYGRAASFTLRPRPGGGTRAEARLPLREHPGAARGSRRPNAEAEHG